VSATASLDAALDGEGLDGEQLADLLMRLIIDGHLRERLATEGAAAVAANAGELECLETVDLDELDSAARRFRSRIWRLGRDGGLASTFPRGLRMLWAAGVGDSDLLDGFLASAHFGRFRLVPYLGPGLSVEEAFASFLLDLPEAGASTTLRETVTHELMIALFIALSCEQPLSFVIETEGVIETDHGHAALRWYSPASLAGWDVGTAVPAGDVVPYAYFATPTGFAQGAVSARLAAAFETTPTPDGDAARRALARRGLW
jgi:hypothetical protein